MILRGINAWARPSFLVAVVFIMVLLTPALTHRLEVRGLSAINATHPKCRGVKVAGGGTALERAVNNRGPGTTFCVGRGTYTVSLRGVKLQDGDVLDGVGRARPGTGGKRPLVRIVGQGTGVIRGAEGVTLRDVSVTDAVGDTGCSSVGACEQTINPGNKWRIERVRIHHADAQCIGSAGHSLVIVNSELDHCGNRFDGKDESGFAGAVKAGANGAFTIRKSYIHNNNQGVWCDVDCSAEHMPFTVTDNRILDNYSFGVHYEHTTKDPSTPAYAIIQDNIARGNNWGELPTKADIGIMSAENAQVLNNKVGATSAHPNKGTGIIFRDTKGRGSASGVASGNQMGGDSLEGCLLAGVVCT